MQDFLLYTRGIERLVEAGSGVLAMLLGWNLFRVGITTDQTAEFGVHTAKLSLHKVGPGIFFALFGAGILFYGIVSPLKSETNGSGASVQIEYLTSDANDLRRTIRALSTPINLVSPETYKTVAQVDLGKIANANQALAALREDLLLRAKVVKLDDLKLWRAEHLAFEQNPTSLPSSEQEALIRVAPWMNDIMADLPDQQ